MLKRVLLVNSGLKSSNWGLQVATSALIRAINEAGGDGLVVEIESVDQSFLFVKSTIRPSKVGMLLQFLTNPAFIESRIGQKLFRPKLPVPKTSDDLKSSTNKFLEQRHKSSHRKIIDQLVWADIVIFQGEGSVYLNNYSARAGFFILWLAKKIYRKKIAFLNGSAGVTSDFPILAGFIQRIEPMCDGFAVRENASREMLKNFGIETLTIADTAFLYDYIETRKKPSTLGLENYVVVSGGMLPVFNAGPLVQTQFFKLLKSLSDSSVKMVFIAIDPEDKRLKNIAQELGAPFFGPETSAEEVIGIIGESSGLLSGRYHHLIFALAQGVPVAVLSTTSQKIRGLVDFYRDLSIPIYNQTALWRDAEFIQRRVMQMVGDSDEWSRRTGEISQSLIRDTREQLKNALGELLG